LIGVAAAGLKAGDCSLTDGSSPGDWRLPTRAEWGATFFGGGHCFPSLANDAGTACLSDGPSSFAGVASGDEYFFWSLTTDEDAPLFVRTAVLYNGSFISQPKHLTMRVWPVRGGPR